MVFKGTAGVYISIPYEWERKRYKGIVLFAFKSRLWWHNFLEARGLKTGVENDILWSEIGSGFGEPGGTPSPRIPRSALHPTPPPLRIRFGEMNCSIQRKEIFPADSANCVILWIVIYPVGSVMHLVNNWAHLNWVLVFRQLILDAILSAISRRGGQLSPVWKKRGYLSAN